MWLGVLCKSSIKKIGITWYAVLAFIVAMSGTVACSSAGGKGLEKARDAAYEYIDEISDESPIEESTQAERGGYSFEYSARIAVQAPSPQDPFGLVPLDWPADIKFHPDAKVAQSRPLASDGYFLLALIPSSRATIMGVQTFHIDDLSSWKSIEVDEKSPEVEGGSPVLTIVAERSGAWLKITAQEGQAGSLTSLENYEYWEKTVGANPLIVRFYYAPIQSTP